jgi:hypothetical protein
MDEETREKLVTLLREIHGTSSVPRKFTGKFAYISDLAGQGLALLGEENPDEGF